MNTVVTSREEILRAAGEMVKVGKGDGAGGAGDVRENGEQRGVSARRGSLG